MTIKTCMIYVVLIFSLIITNTDTTAALNLEKGETALICSEPGARAFHGICGDKIVWQDNRNGNWDIFMYDISTGEEREICNASGDQLHPSISGDIIVWDDGREATKDYVTEDDDWDIWMHDLDTGESICVENTTTNQGNPQISGNTIVCRDYSEYDDEGEDINIWIKEIGSPFVKLADGENRQFSPDLDADDSSKVVWCEIIPEKPIVVKFFDTTYYDYEDAVWLLKYKSNDGTKTIHTSSERSYAPVISGDNIVWMEGQSGNYDLWTLNISSGDNDIICSYGGDQCLPDIDKNNVVWFDIANNGIYLYNFDSTSIKKIASTVPRSLSTGSVAESYLVETGAPVISNDYVVWTDLNSTTGNEDVWLHRIDNSAPILSVNSPESGQILYDDSFVTVSGTVSDSNLFSITVNGVEAVVNGNEWNADIKLNEGDNKLSVLALDTSGNMNETNITVYFHKYADCYLLSPGVDFIESSGSYSRVYKTKYPNSKVTIISDDASNFTYTHTDDAGVFSINVDASDMAVHDSKIISVNELKLEHDGEITFDDLSMFNFTLSVLPRNYSTTWYAGNSVEAGGGALAYVKGEASNDFETTASTQNTDLVLESTQAAGVTAGVKAELFKSPVTTGFELELPSLDVHGKAEVTRGSQVSLNYTNSSLTQKHDAVLYLLSSLNPTSTSVAVLNLISDSYLDPNDAPLETDYCESGTSLSAGAAVNLIEVKVDSLSKSDPTVNKFAVGVEGEIGKYLAMRNYPLEEYSEYHSQTLAKWEANCDQRVFSLPLLVGSYGESVETTEIIGKDKNGVLTSKLKVKTTAEPSIVGLKKFATKEITYDTGIVQDPVILKNDPFEAGLLDRLVSPAFSQVRENIHNDYTSITAEESSCMEVGIDIPLELQAGIYSIDVGVGGKGGIANNYITDEGLVFSGKEYYYKQYPDDPVLQDPDEYPAVEIKGIITSLMNSVADESSVSEKFPTVDADDILPNEDIQDITVISYVPEKPTDTTLELFEDDGYSSEYLESSSGANLAVGSIKKIQSSDSSGLSNAQINLNYNENEKSLNELDEMPLNGTITITHDIIDDKVVWSGALMLLNFSPVLAVTSPNETSYITLDFGQELCSSPVISENYISWTTFLNNSGIYNGEIWAYDMEAGRKMRVTNSSARLTNRVANGGFEAGIPGWWRSSNGKGENWTVVGNAYDYDGVYGSLAGSQSYEGEMQETFVVTDLDLTGVDTLSFYTKIYERSFSGTGSLDYSVFIGSSYVYSENDRYEIYNQTEAGIQTDLSSTTWVKKEIDVSEYTGTNHLMFGTFSSGPTGENTLKVLLDSVSAMSSSSSNMVDISGDKVVWMDEVDLLRGDIFMCDLSTGAHTKISSDSDEYLLETQPKISGNDLVWTAENNTYPQHTDIRYYDISEGERKTICAESHNQFSPDISGDKIVWVDDRNGISNCDIYMYDLSSKETQVICDESGNQINPRISGNKIVWEDERSGNPDIYMYDLYLEEEFVICNNSFNQSQPVISGDYIAWIDDRNVLPQTYMKSLIDESKMSVYEWDEYNGFWVPIESQVDVSSQNVSADISDLGTYVIGYDSKKPVIEWDYSELYIGNITIMALITDVGSGVDNSSIKVYLDEQEQNFTYNMHSGLLYASIDAPSGDHTIQLYAEDTSGNAISTPKRVISNIMPVAVSNLDITKMTNDSIYLSWTGENGDYSIDHYAVYINGKFAKNATEPSCILDACYNSAYSVCPVDTEGYNGNEDTIELKSSIFVPRFTYDWEDSLDPAVHNLIIFDASSSTVINDTFENPVNYEWIIDDDLNNTKSGIIMNHVFTSTGLHKVTLRVKDEQTSEMTTQLIHVQDYPSHWDWNPWNDLGSDDGACINTTEFNEAYYHYYINETAPYTGAVINPSRIDAIIFYYVYGFEMPEGTEIVPPVVAEFEADVVSGIQPLAVNFTDQSALAENWEWDFNNDGIVDSTIQNPEYTYTDAGTYNVSLTVSNANGSDTKLRTHYINVNPRVIANFTADVVSGTPPLSVNFTDLSNDAESWAWDFNSDGTVDSTEKNPRYTYTDAGTYNVSLTVTNGISSDTLIKENCITVLLLPVANFNADVTYGYKPLDVHFTDLSTGAESWAWDFNNDGIVDSIVRNPEYTYTESGTYTVSLTVNNANGSDTKLKTNYIKVKSPPTCGMCHMSSAASTPM
ncbi:PKD domain-containing protein [uncultured Methanolobus sp.]|uniref:PKD domain-containing protein n=1 Tax=uncultured Methanolobus sp. TaxID=218300 RepID=UPI002AAAD6FB|nr:PKD domain-containing protein [uncultured Methanolobus sp.]